MMTASLSMPLVSSLRRLFRNKAILIGAIILAVVLVAAVLAPWVAPYAPNKLSIVNKLKAPSLAHVFGTDEFGRDIFSRAIYAGRISLLVSLGVVSISTVLGVILAYVPDEWATGVALPTPVPVPRFNPPPRSQGDAVQAHLLELLAAGAIHPVVGAARPFEELPAALEDMEARRTTGRVVLTR